MKVKTHVFLVQGLQHIVAVKWTLTSCDAFLMAFMSEKIRKEINCLTSISKKTWSTVCTFPEKNTCQLRFLSSLFLLKKNKTFKNCCCHGAWQLVGPCLCCTFNYCGAIFRMSTYSFPGQRGLGGGSVMVMEIGSTPWIFLKKSLVKLSRWVKGSVYCFFFCLGNRW